MSNSFSYPGGELKLFRQAQHWKRYFSGYLLPYLHGQVLEVGAGTGNTTPFLNRNASITSWTLLEPDATMARQLRLAVAKGMLPANCATVHGDTHSLSSDLFDAIVYIDVLEHIGNDREELERATRMLRPNGHLMVLSPAFERLYSPFDQAIGHYRRYNRRSLSALADKDQLQLRKLIYLDSAGGLLSLGNRLLLKQSYPTLQQVKWWDRWLVPLSTITDTMLLHTFGRSILAIWQKK